MGIMEALCAGTKRSSSRDFCRNPGIRLSRFLCGCGSAEWCSLRLPPPAPLLAPGCQQDPAGPSWGGLGSPGDGSVGRSECSLCVKACCAGGRTARSPSIGRGEPWEGWGAQDGRKEGVQVPPHGPSLPLALHSRGAHSVQGASTELSGYRSWGEALEETGSAARDGGAGWRLDEGWGAEAALESCPWLSG